MQSKHFLIIDAKRFNFFTRNHKVFTQYLLNIENSIMYVYKEKSRCKYLIYNDF